MAGWACVSRRSPPRRGRVHQNGGMGAPNRGSRRGGSAARGKKGGQFGLAGKMLCFPTESWHVNCIFAGLPRLSFPNSPKEPSHVPTPIPLIPTFPPIPTTGHLRQGTNHFPRDGEPCLPQGHRQAGIRHVSGARIHSWIGRAGLAIREQGIDRRKTIELTCPVRGDLAPVEVGRGEDVG